MDEQVKKSGEGYSDDMLYLDMENWKVNKGEKTIHAKRMPGKFRTIKYLTESFWLIFFLGPYLRWNGKQAILFDIPGREFHFFSMTILPQDIWMLSLLLLLLAMTLFAVTSVASRVFCGYFCFQTSWVDLFTWIEEKLEGNPTQRNKLDQAPWDATKIRIKATKHIIWLLISILTGISFSIWFTDAFDYWRNLMHFNLPMVGWVVLAMFIAGTYILAGFLREQACFWLCPYARIQGVMSDMQTILPTYDEARGEPRGKIRRGADAENGPKQGDCIDCFQCVQVCPTGVDIRMGQQLGCITCGLCIDACDSVMDKVGRPRGLIRYASLDEIQGRPVKKFYQHPRTIGYTVVLFLALLGIIWGMTHLGALELKVMPERQPLFVQLSDGSIQNKYMLKVLNKTDKDFQIVVNTDSTIQGIQVSGLEGELVARHGHTTNFTIFIKAPSDSVKAEVTPLDIRVANKEHPEITASYKTMFNGPKH